MFKILAFVALIMTAASAAHADDRALITHQRQEMSDALTGGDVAVWDKYVDPGFIFAEEDGSYKGKAEALKEVRPLPKGLGGSIHVELLSYHEEDGIAVALFRQVETENYYAQTIHANYLTLTTWRKKAAGWKEIAEQVLAEKTDPPAVALPAAQLAQYARHLQTERLRRRPTWSPSRTANSTPRATAANRSCGTRKRRMCSSPTAIRASGISSSAMPQGHVTGFVERRESWDIVWEKIG